MTRACWSKEPSPPGRVFYLLCSLIKSRVYEVSRRDATVASRREISYTRLLIREHRKKKPPPGGGGFFQSMWHDSLTWHGWRTAGSRVSRILPWKTMRHAFECTSVSNTEPINSEFAGAVTVLSCYTHRGVMSYINRACHTIYNTDPINIKFVGAATQLWGACAIRLPSHSYGWLQWAGHKRGV